jgi:hypothetical protein
MTHGGSLSGWRDGTEPSDELIECCRDPVCSLLVFQGGGQCGGAGAVAVVVHRRLQRCGERVRGEAPDRDRSPGRLTTHTGVLRTFGYSVQIICSAG